ncbi:hypothetical protein KJ786_03170 [Patescibacteria group bacterium]|nr:hypothetical protein [Patescibacteria group bacterium]
MNNKVTIIVYGVPLCTSQELLAEMIADFQILISGVKGLNVSQDGVSIFFPQDLYKKGLGGEIIISVVGLYVTAELLKEVCRRLSEATKRSYFQKAYVRCVVQPIIPPHIGTDWSSEE